VTAVGVERWAVVVSVLVAACGARTGIEIAGSATDREDSGRLTDGQTAPSDVARDAESLLDTSIASPDTSTDVRQEATSLADARADAPADARSDIFQPPPTCDPAADFIYVLSSPNSLYRFDPSSRSSTLIGQIDCLTGVESMAVDRQGIAWIEDLSRAIHTVDTRNAHCLSVVLQLTPPFTPSGMAFVSDGPGSATETLYLGGTGALGAVDPRRIAVRPLATWSIGPAELTGSPDGRLFALFALDTPEHIDELDKTTGAVLTRFDIGSGFGSPISRFVGFGFAYWRNGFWVFAGAQAFRYELGSSTLTETVSTPFSAAGAGVSTCDVPVDASADARLDARPPGPSD